MKQHSTGSISPLIVAAAAALLIVATAAWLTRSAPEPQPASVSQASPTNPKELVRPIDATDHVYGNPAAPLVLIVYADFECPFCSEYHDTLKLVAEQYGKDGRVAIVYRHMPIVTLHPKSPTYALASECVAQNAGNKGFWDFADLMYATITPDTTLTSEDLTQLAQQAGVPADDFRLCMRTSNLMSRVEKDFDEALEAGASATPFTVITTPFQQVAREGMRDYRVVAGTVQTMLRNLGDHATVESDGRTMQNMFE